MLRSSFVLGAVVLCAASASQPPPRAQPQNPSYAQPAAPAPYVSPLVEAPANDECPADLIEGDGSCRGARRAGPPHCEITAECERLCDRGDAKACTELGFAHMVGRQVGLDRRRAYTLFEKACAGGDHYGCNNQGAILISRDAVPYAELQVAVGLFDQSCEREPKLCTNRAVMFRDGIHSRIDKARAAELFSRACVGGDGAACHDLALAYDKGSGVAKDESRAAELEIQACRLGFAHGCVVAGVNFFYGDGVAKDQTEAARYFRHACSRGNLWGCGMVGMMVMEGLGGERHDPAGGRRQMETACERGSHDTCAILGVLLRAKGDRRGARQWLRRACEGGKTDYCN
jgi:hypothetical protein